MTHLLRPGRLEVETDLLLGAEEVLLPSGWIKSCTSALDTDRTQLSQATKSLPPRSLPSTSRGFDSALFEPKPSARGHDESRSVVSPSASASAVQTGPSSRPNATQPTLHATSPQGSQPSHHQPPDQARSFPTPPQESGASGGITLISDSIAVPAEGRTNAERLEALCAMHAVSCPHCTVARGHTNLVFGEGNSEAEMVFVGEAPGESEDLAGRPFVGKAGEKLDEMIRAMGLSRESVYIANVLKARPPENRTPLAHEVERCGPYLLAQLAIIRPKVIITLGGPATKLLLKSELGITRLRGALREVSLGAADGKPFTVPVMPTFHPAYLLRNYTVEVRKQMWDDLKQALAVLGQTPPAKS